MENRKKLVRGIISAVLSLILATAITLLGLLWSVARPISRQGIFRVLEECGYTEEMIAKINEDFEILCETSGIPPSLADSFLREEVTEENMLFPLRQMFGEEGTAADTEELKKNLSSRIEAYALTLRGKGELEVTDEEWEEMQAGFPQLSAFFVEEINAAINMKGIYSTLGAFLAFAGRLLPYLAWASASAFLAASGMLLMIWKKKILFFVYLTASSGGILLLAPSVYLTASDFVMRLGLDPMYLRMFFNGIVSSLCRRMIIAGSLLFVAGVLCGLALVILKWRKKEAEKKEVL